MINLREYQQQVIDDVRAELKAGARSVLIQLPTGGGKTALTAKMIGTAAGKGLSSWFVVHRRELIRQSTRTFYEVGIPHGLVVANHFMDRKKRVQLASVQTLGRRLGKLPPPKLIAWDEAHHITAGTWDKIYQAYPNAIHIGLTATPQRLDGSGLGDHFETMVQGPDVGWLIEHGFLSPFRMFSMPSVSMDGVHHQAGDFKRREVLERLERSTVMGDVVSHYLQHAAGRRGIVFEASIERSQRLAEAFRARGVPAMHVDGKTEDAIRDRAMDDLERGRLKILTNVDLFGEGVDVPAIEYIGCCRPTDSLGLWLQQCGRGLRPSPGKKDCLIFDHAGNLQRHGPPDMPREWTLLGREKVGKGPDSGPPIRQCPSCYAMNPPGSQVCSDCGKPFPVNQREIDEIEGSLEEVHAAGAKQLEEADLAEEKQKSKEEQAMARDRESLIELGKRRGMKHPDKWADHVIAGRRAKQKRRAYS